MEQHAIESEDYALGMQLRQRADQWTDLRSKLAYLVGPGVIADGQSWLLFAITCLAAESDYRDGQDGKEANRLLGIKIDNKSSEDDHKADKKFAYITLAGIMIRDFIDGHPVSGASVGGVIAVHGIRDSKQAVLRRKARDENKSVSAIGINRWKSGIMMGMEALAVSPPGATRAGRLVRNAGLWATAGMGVFGYFEFKKHLEQASPISE